MLTSYDEEIQSISQKTELEDHFLSAVCHGLVNLFTVIGQTEEKRCSNVTKKRVKEEMKTLTKL
jgi:hypothetical protein